MNRVLIYLGRCLIILFGYLAASLAASAFLNVVTLGALGFDADQAPAIAMGAWIFSIPFIALFVAYFAFVPSVAVILLGEVFGRRDWLTYALAGAAVAIVVLGFFWHAAGSMSVVSGALDPGQAGEDTASALTDPRLTLLVIGAGIFGGLAYWLVAGRLAGNWRGGLSSPRSASET